MVQDGNMSKRGRWGRIAKLAIFGTIATWAVGYLCVQALMRFEYPMFASIMWWGRWQSYVPRPVGALPVALGLWLCFSAAFGGPLWIFQRIVTDEKLSLSRLVSLSALWGGLLVGLLMIQVILVFAPMTTWGGQLGGGMGVTDALGMFALQFVNPHNHPVLFTDQFLLVFSWIVAWNAWWALDVERRRAKQSSRESARS